MSIHSRMIDDCLITRSEDDPVFDPDTGEYTAPPPTTVYEGPCLVMPMGIQDAQARKALIGERAVNLVLYDAYLPLGASAVQKDDAFVLTKSKDPQLVNRPLEIESFAVSSHQKARHLVLEEVR